MLPAFALTLLESVLKQQLVTSVMSAPSHHSSAQSPVVASSLTRVKADARQLLTRQDPTSTPPAPQFLWPLPACLSAYFSSNTGFLAACSPPRAVPLPLTFFHWVHIWLTCSPVWDILLTIEKKPLASDPCTLSISLPCCIFSIVLIWTIISISWLYVSSH